MRKGLKIALLSVAGVVVLASAAVQIVLNSRIVTDAIDDFAKENVAGELKYSGLHLSIFKHFPSVSLYLDSLSVTYPSEQSPASADTLLSTGKVDLRVNPWRLIGGCIAVNRAEIVDLSAFLNVPSAGKSNLEVLSFLSSGTDTLPKEKKPLSIPHVSVGRFGLLGTTRLRYESVPDDLRARVEMEEVLLSGSVLAKDGKLSVAGLRFSMDTLSLAGASGRNSVDFRLSGFSVEETGPEMYDLALLADAALSSPELGRLEIPLQLGGAVGFRMDSDRTDVKAEELTALLAYVPLQLDGEATFYKDSIAVDATASIEDCDVESILRKYADSVLGTTSDISTTAHLTADLSAVGVYDGERIPAVEACLRIPASTTNYAPRDLSVRHTVDIDAVISPDKVLDADIHQFDLAVPGLDLSLGGGARDLLGKNPLYRLSADARADVEKLADVIELDKMGFEHAEGDLHLVLDADTHHSELQNFRFDKAHIKGSLGSSHLHLKMPEDSLETCLFKSKVLLSSGREGLDLKADFDSVYFNRGVGLVARVRNIRNEAKISKTLQGGEMLPLLEASTLSDRIFLKTSSGRIGVNGADLSASAQKIVPREHRHVHGTSFRRGERDADFERADVDISLDSSIVKYLDSWSAHGHIKADGGFYASPKLPLRTRLTALHADFDDEKIEIDTLGVTTGTTDLGMSAVLTGVKDALIHKSQITTKIDLKSNRINVNELLAARLAGKDDVAQVAPEDETDESFVTDTLENARVDMKKIPIFIVPSNIDLVMNLEARRVDFSDPKIGPVYSGVKMKNRTAQLTGTYITTELGLLYMDAFYSTKSKQDISAGVNLSLSQMSAEDIIRLIPQVDSLMPVLKSFEGKLGCDISATAQIDTLRNVIIPTLDGLVRISGDNLKVTNNGQFGKVANYLLFRNRETLDIDNMNVDALIHDSRIDVFPFVLGADRYKFALRGTQSFDRSMYYHVSILKSPLPIRFGLNIYGTLDDTRVSLCRAKYKDGSVPAYTAQLDTMQFNLASAIENVYGRGVESVIRHNENAVETLGEESYLHDPLSTSEDDRDDEEIKEYVEMADNYVAEHELLSQVNAVEAEVNAALEASAADAARLMEEYEKTTYDRKVNRWMDKLRRRSGKK